jgi:hypothetical protein
MSSLCGLAKTLLRFRDERNSVPSKHINGRYVTVFHVAMRELALIIITFLCDM